MFNASWSPDQEHVAVLWHRPSRTGLWVVSAGDTAQQRVIPVYVSPSRWDDSGSGILAFREHSIVRISYPAGDTTTVAVIPDEDVTSVDFSPDLKTVVYTVSESKSDVWLVEGFDPDVK
jgi:dipeptidyl aminopeptidase/acylaminoacyl peptidase